MDKNKKSLIIKKIWIISLVLLVLQWSIENFMGLELLIFGLNSNVVRAVLAIILLLTPIYIIGSKKNKILTGVYSIFAVIAIVTMVIYGVFSMEDKYYYLHSADNKRTLVVEEISVLSYGQSNFYEKKYGIFIKSLNNVITTDNGYRPFSNKEYKVNWVDENTLQIDYDYDSKGVWKSEIIKLK